MGRYLKKTKIPKVEEEVEEEDLERFAGSSDDEGGDDAVNDDDVNGSEEEDEDEEIPKKRQQQQEPQQSNQPKPESRSSPQEKEKPDSESSDDEEEEEISDSNDDENDDDDIADEEIDLPRKAAGMANAMARILASNKSTAKKSAAAPLITTAPSSAPIVLSKTTTPLQRMAQKEKEKEKEQRQKRKANRERNLAALHIPLRNGGEGLAQELDRERLYRRVATRGVVALFNAIAQHQKKDIEVKPSTKVKEESKMNKHTFLDMIKTAAATKAAALATSSTAANTTTSTTTSQPIIIKVEQTDDSNQIAPATQPSQKPAPKTKAAPVKSKWNALQDDYMLDGNTKKGWDQESSDDNEDNGEDEIPENWDQDDDDDAIVRAKSKRQRLASR